MDYFNLAPLPELPLLNNKPSNNSTQRVSFQLSLPPVSPTSRIIPKMKENYFLFPIFFCFSVSFTWSPASLLPSNIRFENLYECLPSPASPLRKTFSKKTVQRTHGLENHAGLDGRAFLLPERISEGVQGSNSLARRFPGSSSLHCTARR